jgi:hypothetical protein
VRNLRDEFRRRQTWQLPRAVYLKGAVFVSYCVKMLKKRYVLNFIIHAKFNIQNKIFVISILGRGDVVFLLSLVGKPPNNQSLLEIGGGKFFTA